jgi:hypothetical protein
MEPFAQRVGRGQIAQPLVYGRTILAQAARPEAVHQNPRSVGAGRFFVHSFYVYSFRCHSIPAPVMALLYYCSGLFLGLTDKWNDLAFLFLENPES